MKDLVTALEKSDAHGTGFPAEQDGLGAIGGIGASAPQSCRHLRILHQCGDDRFWNTIRGPSQDIESTQGMADGHGTVMAVADAGVEIQGDAGGLGQEVKRGTVPILEIHGRTRAGRSAARSLDLLSVVEMAGLRLRVPRGQIADWHPGGDTSPESRSFGYHLPAPPSLRRRRPPSRCGGCPRGRATGRIPRHPGYPSPPDRSRLRQDPG